MRVHESHYAGRAIIIFATFFGVHKFALLKLFVSFQVSNVSCTHKRRDQLAHSLYMLWIKQDRKQLASFPDPTCLPANIHAMIFFPPKAGRSGRFGDVVLISHGRGLARHGHGLEE